MANKEHFKQEEIPYGILAKFGLTQEMIEDLPQNVIHRLLSSRTTPVLPIVTENIDGETILSYARILSRCVLHSQMGGRRSGGV